MNLEDLVDEKGLQQDEWSLTRPKFGRENQLTVVGWSGKQSRNKYYIIKCDNCCKDSELFGNGYFRSLKGDLNRGISSCGCTVTRWTKQQYEVLCHRAAVDMGYKFTGFCGDWLGSVTKVFMECNSHGVWSTGTIINLLRGRRGCPKCKYAKNAGRSRKPDSEMIASFFASGAFDQDTKFWRSDRKTKKGSIAYWYVECPVCQYIAEVCSGDLQRGVKSCECRNRSHQKQAYINFILDGDLIIGVKFGIATDSTKRTQKQNYTAVYKITNHETYIFPSNDTCRAAERECKETLETGIISKNEMPDGWTETTYTGNLPKIVEIYQKHGGILKIK